MHKIKLIFLLLLVTRQLHSQEGLLTGKVFDHKTSEVLIGATVMLVNTSLGASTDINGEFNISKIPFGIYNLKISFIGYETRIINDLKINSSETNKIDVGLTEDVIIEQEEVVITAKAIRSGEGAILNERKKSFAIGDAIGVDQIKKTADATSGDALKRVTGINIVDNKFIYIRGVTDRYNQTTLNGATISSTSVDKKSFSFDMLPSNLIENLTISKTASADLTGEFTGGLVQMSTLEFPDELTMKIGYGQNVNSITTFKNFNKSMGTNLDWIGFGNNVRSFSNTGSDINILASKLPNNWSTKKILAPISQSFNLSLGNNYELEEGKLGLISALTFKNNLQHNEIYLSEIANTKTLKDLNGSNDKIVIMLGAILDLTYEIDESDKISFKNNYNHVAEDKNYFLSGVDLENEEYLKSYQIEWEERNIISTQFKGEHYLAQIFDSYLDWTLYFNESKTSKPDRKELTYSLSTYNNFDTDLFIAKPGERSWSNIYDKIRGVNYNISIPIKFGKIKSGFSNDNKVKNYDMKYYQIYSNYISPDNLFLLTLPIEEIYEQENFGSGKFILLPFTNLSGGFLAKQNISAFYLLTDLEVNTLGVPARINAGIRVENSLQVVSTLQGRLGADKINTELRNVDYLPSINLNFPITEKQNFRFAYSHTINRPEFREMSDMYFYDFEKSEFVHGNSKLKQALIKNYDFRYEIFPNNGEVISLSYFYKYFTNPIEEIKSFTSSTVSADRTWLNVERGVNNGWEFELRKNLGFLSNYLTNSQLVLNYTRIFSLIPYKVNIGNSIEEKIVEGFRPMQGQSPYTYNVAFFFTDPNYLTSINILYNEYGARIDAVGDVRTGDGDIYENKRGTLDITLSQPLYFINEKLVLNFSIKNLTNQPIVYTQANTIYRKFNVGVNCIFQVSYSM